MSLKKITKKENGLLRFLTLIRKELSIIISDKQALMIVFLLPLLSIFAVGSTGASLGGTSGEGAIDMLASGRLVKIGVVNLDTSVGDPNHVLSEEFIKILDDQPDTLLTRFDNQSVAEEAMYYEKIWGYVVIHDGFEFNVSAHIPTLVVFYSDSLDLLAQPLIAKKINDAIYDFKYKFNFTEDELEYESEELWSVDSPLFVSLPMITVITVFASGLMLSCQSVVGDNPINRVSLTPAKKFEILSSKIVAYTILEMGQGLFLLIPSMIAFNMTFTGNFFAVWGYVLFPSFGGITLGVFLSTIAKTKLQGSQFFILGFMTFFILGSGVFLPEGTLELVFPLYHAQLGILLVAYKDLPFVYTWNTIWPQIVFGFAFFMIAYFIFVKQKRMI
ncbi:MAG: ABC transporter permease [Promethearchaeota archaeon]